MDIDTDALRDVPEKTPLESFMILWGEPVESYEDLHDLVKKNAPEHESAFGFLFRTVLLTQSD
jgi:hypothetical protein